MENMKILSKKLYDEYLDGASMFSGDMVCIIGEQTVEVDGKVIEQYLYNICGYAAKNGRPFVALKSNIVVF